jgi:hypothetical protein
MIHEVIEVKLLSRYTGKRRDRRERRHRRKWKTPNVERQALSRR